MLKSCRGPMTESPWGPPSLSSCATRTRSPRTTPRWRLPTARLTQVHEGMTRIALPIRRDDPATHMSPCTILLFPPSDATYDFKYGIRAVAGGGRSSARETIGRVAAGAVAKKLLKQVAGTEVLAYVNRVRDVAVEIDNSSFTMEDIEANMVRCPDPVAAEEMIKGETTLCPRSPLFSVCLSLCMSVLLSVRPSVCLFNLSLYSLPPLPLPLILPSAAVDEVRNRGESCGGEVTCVVRGCPRGLGAPVFDKLEAELAKALMSLPATKVTEAIQSIILSGTWGGGGGGGLK